MNTLHLRAHHLRRGVGLALALGFCGVLLFSSDAIAEPSNAGVGEADRHFQEGVALYTEGDYRGALVEFTRAYTLAPNGVVLFNVGETQYQLRDYAAALETFQQYLIEAPADDTHRVIAERNIKELVSRVAQLRVITVPPGATVSVNDRILGQTPFRKPVMVGVGQLTVRAALPGRPVVERAIEIAAEDEVLVAMEVPWSRAASAPAETGLGVESSAPSSKNHSAIRTAGWVATGILAGAAVTFGLLAWSESNDLRQARASFPTTGERISHLADQTRTFSVVADSFTAAALVVGGITLYSTVTAGTSTRSAQLTVGFGTLKLDGRF
jgi:tetratricopeptide (TPR) repeat protein